MFFRNRFLYPIESTLSFVGMFGSDVAFDEETGEYVIASARVGERPM